MGYSMKDLENMGRKLNEDREARAEQKGRELADNIINQGGIFALLSRIICRGFAFLGAGMLVAGLLAWLMGVDQGLAGALGVIPAWFIIRRPEIWLSPFKGAVALWVAALLVIEVFV